MKKLISILLTVALLLPIFSFVTISARASVPETLLPLITTARNVEGGIYIEWTDPNMGRQGYSRDYYVMGRCYIEGSGWSEWRTNQGQWDCCGFTMTGGNLTVWEGNTLDDVEYGKRIIFETGKRYQFSAIATHPSLNDPTEVSPINPSNEIVMLTIDCVYVEVQKDCVRVFPGQDKCTNCFYRREKTGSSWSEWEELSVQEQRIYEDRGGVAGKTYQYGVIKTKDGFESAMSLSREIVYPSATKMTTTTTTTKVTTTTTTAKPTTVTTGSASSSSSTSGTTITEPSSTESRNETQTTVSIADVPPKEEKGIGGWLVLTIVFSTLLVCEGATVLILLMKKKT